MKSILKEIFNKSLSEEKKNKIRCFYWNNIKRTNFRRQGFKIYYNKGLFKVTHPNTGPMLFYGNPYSDFADALIGYFDNYKPKKGDMIIDAGAYIGVFAIFCSKLLKGECKIVAFEPDEKNYEILKRNLKINKIKNIKTSKKALWSKKDKIPFAGDQEEASHLSERSQTNKKIDVDSLDNQLKKSKSVNFIKMDIEGAEIEAIKGCKKLIKKNKDIHFAIASYHLINGEPSYIGCEKLFKKLGMQTHTKYLDAHTTTYGFKSVF